MGRPANKRRKTIQKKRRQLQTVREDLQLMGAEPTVPEGAIRDERVDPRSQDEQRFPGLDRMAIRNAEGWGITEPVMRKIVEVNAEVIYERKTYIDKDGNEKELPPDRQSQVQASRVLMMADERDWERKNPEAAGKAKGGVTVGVQVNNGIDWAALIGEKVIDPAEQRLKELDEQIENKSKEQNHDESRAEQDGLPDGGRGDQEVA